MMSASLGSQWRGRSPPGSDGSQSPPRAGSVSPTPPDDSSERPYFEPSEAFTAEENAILLQLSEQLHSNNASHPDDDDEESQSGSVSRRRSSRRLSLNSSSSIGSASTSSRRRRAPRNSLHVLNTIPDLNAMPQQGGSQRSVSSRSRGSLSQASGRRKRSRFLPQPEAFLDEHSIHSFLSDVHEHDTEHGDEETGSAGGGCGENDSVSSSGSSSTSGGSTKSPAFADISPAAAFTTLGNQEMMDYSEHSLHLGDLVAGMEEEKVEKKKRDEIVKKMEEVPLDEISDSDSYSCSSEDFAEKREREVRSSMFFAFLNLAVVGVLAKAMGKLQKMFNKSGDGEDVANEVAGEAVDAAREETIDRASQMAMLHAQNSSSSSLMGGAPVPVPGGAETQ